MIAAIPYAANACAAALAEWDCLEAVVPLSVAFGESDDPNRLAVALTKLTGDGTWCEQAWVSGKGTVHGHAQLLRAWADHPTPGLVMACQGLVGGHADRSYPGRRAQLAAIEVLHCLGQPPDPTPTLEAIIAAGGETSAEADQVMAQVRGSVPYQ